MVPRHFIFRYVTCTNNQCCIFRFGSRFGLAIGMVYFGTGQYRRFVSGLTLYIYLLIYMFIHQNL